MRGWSYGAKVAATTFAGAMMACGASGDDTAGAAPEASGDAAAAGYDATSPIGSDAPFADGSLVADTARDGATDAAIAADADGSDSAQSGLDGAASPCKSPAPPQSGGKTYYVAAQDGSDGKTGLAGQPFATLQKAADTVQPGDTVIVEDGTYTSTSESVLSIGTGGTLANWIVFRARNRWGAVIDGNGQNAEAVNFATGVGYVRIEGFEIVNATGPAGAAGINCNDGGHDVQIVQNHIHHIGRTCTDSVYGLDAIFIRQPNVTIEQNLVHDIGRLAPGENGCSPTTAYYQNHDHGVYVDGDTPGASHAVIRNNVFHDCARGWAIQLYPGTLTDVAIENNTFYGPNPWRDGHIVIYGITLSSSTIVNNVFLDPTGSAITVGGGPTITSTTVSHNLTNRSAMLDVGTQPGITLTGNLTAQTASLEDPAGGKFAPLAASPAVDAGETLSDVVGDFDGVCRPKGVGYDIGAFER